MAVPEPNGSVFQRRYSRAYDQPIVYNSNKGGVVVRTDLDGSNSTMASYDAGKLDSGLEAVGALLAKATLCVLTLVGLAVGILGKASLEVASQFIGFMILFVFIFLACSATFYWWGVSCRSNIKFSAKSILSVYCVCIASDIMAYTVYHFSRMPPNKAIPVDISYFVCFTTVLFFSFSLLFHNNGLNAMFARESVLFILCSVVFNYSSSRLFSELLPRIILPQMVHAGMLLGLSLALAGYQFPQISPSGLYWLLSQRGGATAQVKSHMPEISVDHSPQGSMRKVSNSSTQSKPRVSISSMSSMNSTFPQGVDVEAVSEARGLLSDLLMDHDAIPVETQQKLRRVKDMLAIRQERSLASPRIMFGSSCSLVDEEHDYESDVSSRASSVAKKAPTSLTVQSAWLNKQRSLSVVQMRRSSSKFSTTTTASGMPVLENEPLDRTRSVALRDVKARISQKEKRFSVHKMGRERLGSAGDIRQRLGSAGDLRPSSAPKDRQSSISTTSYKTVSESDGSDVDSAAQATSTATGPSQIPQEGSSSTSPGKVSPALVQGPSGGDESLDSIQEGMEFTTGPPRPRSYTDPTGHRSLTVLDEKEETLEPLPEKTGDKKESEEVAEGVAKSEEKAAAQDEDDKVFGEAVFKEHKFYSFTKYKRPSESCDLSEYTSNEHLDMFENVAIWDYPIFELEKKAGNHILSHMAHMLFHEAGLMETFQVPQREFINFFRALEANYGSNVYHNKTHAADVLHAVSYLMFEFIPEFSHEFQTDSATREWKGYSRGNSGGNIASAFSILEVMASYMAAAMHDFDHPGRTNAFLVGTKSHLALLYNDRSVLENHHAAASWHLLTNFEENNFLVSLDPAEMKRLRFLIIEAILATDLKMHFDLLSTFKSKMNPEDGGGIDWESEMDRLLVMQMVIKMADINTPTKSFDLHRSWSKRITEEFYQQSEEESALSLPATIFMDRKHPEKLPAIQLSFIQHLVSPLFQACAEAGIIPGILETIVSPDGDTGSASPTGKKEAADVKGEGDVVTGTDQDGDDNEAFSIGNEASEEADSKFMSIILTNLQVNFEGWKAELPKEEATKDEEEEAAMEPEEKDSGNEEDDDDESGGIQIKFSPPAQVEDKADNP